jgi:molybdate transport repressor ModE-like protein
MDPKRMLIFRAVARAGSISGAARELGWTQPAVSQHLRALERSAGCALLLRGPGGVQLTEPGRVLLTRADAVAVQLHMAEEELVALSELRRGRVLI